MTSVCERIGLPHRRGLFLPFVVLLVALCFAHAHAASSEESEAARLAEIGYSPDEYLLLLEWNERAANGRLVYGFRVAPRDTLIPFDCYLSDAGDWLDDAALTALGIEAKDWDAPPVMRATERKPGLPVKQAPQRIAPKSLGLSVPELVLPPVDMVGILEEDGEVKAPLRIGVFQDIPGGIAVRGKMADYAEWRTLVDGVRVWAMSIRSPEARGIRVHYEVLRLPSGGYVIVYNDSDPDEMYGPFASQDDFWVPTCFGEAVTIECVVASDAKIDEVHIVIDRLAHNYLDLPIKAAGPCNLDVTCYPDWAGAALGVGGIGSIGAAGSLWCTGSLLADGNPITFTPYFLTANHCVGNASKASTIEVYWLYQTDICNGTPPSPVSVPRTTGGADYLAGSPNTTGNDFSLLRLRNDPPAGLTYLGFATGLVAIGWEAVCIHHPSSDFKRISFGTITDDGSPSSNYVPLKPLDRYHEVLWHAGTTEGGSSGSPLFLESTQMIIGQLWGGRASCSRPEEPDYYGRFDITYPLVKAWLDVPLSPYDLDRSGTVDARDVQLALDAALLRQDVPQADVDGSGRADATDVQLVIIAMITGSAA